MDKKKAQFELKNVLFDLESELRNVSLWDPLPPTDVALHSDMPFCIDTLSFQQWLQFVLIPRCYQLIEEDAELAMGASILPMAEESFKGKRGLKTLFAILKSLDEMLA